MIGVSVGPILLFLLILFLILIFILHFLSFLGALAVPFESTSTRPSIEMGE